MYVNYRFTCRIWTNLISSDITNETEENEFHTKQFKKCFTFAIFSVCIFLSSPLCKWKFEDVFLAISVQKMFSF